MSSPYPEEVRALQDNLEKGVDERAQAIKEQRHACVIFLRRTRRVWSEFNKQFQEYKTGFYMGENTKFYSSLYYSSWSIVLTENSAEARMFTVEEAVEMAKGLPFESEILWKTDDRTRCPKCDQVSKIKHDDKMNLVYFCPNKKCKLFKP